MMYTDERSLFRRAAPELRPRELVFSLARQPVSVSRRKYNFEAYPGRRRPANRAYPYASMPVARAPWHRFWQSLDQRRIPSASSRTRQQCGPSPEGIEEEDAARGRLSRDEAARSLRKALRT